MPLEAVLETLWFLCAWAMQWDKDVASVPITGADAWYPDGQEPWADPGGAPPGTQE